MFSTVGMCEQAVAAFTKVHTINKSFWLAILIPAVPSAFFKVCFRVCSVSIGCILQFFQVRYGRTKIISQRRNVFTLSIFFLL